METEELLPLKKYPLTLKFSANADLTIKIGTPSIIKL